MVQVLIVIYTMEETENFVMRKSRQWLCLSLKDLSVIKVSMSRN